MGAISFKKGTAEVLKQARGEALHAKDIWERMQAMGVRSNAKNPVGWVNRETGKHPNIEKDGPKTWRWAGPLHSNVSN